jgi:hypothetical protein
MIIATVFLFLPSCSAFLNVRAGPGTASPFRRISSTNLNLVPLSKYAGELTFFSEPETHRCCIDAEGHFNDEQDVYELALLEEEDLPDLSRFVIATFGADAIRLSQDMNSFERLLMTPAAELLNGYSTLVAFAEVFSGTKQRLTGRFQKMDIAPPQLGGLSRKEMIDLVEKDSLILALAKRHEGEDSRIEVIASIELRLQVRRLIAHF